MKKLKTLGIIVLHIATSYSGFGQCANISNIFSFDYNGKTYEVVRDNLNWEDAAACAVERGGILTEINSLSEQNEIFSQVNTNASINITNTIAPDGGGSSYVWIGGNDITSESNWIWDGNNDASGAQFWSGGPSPYGASVGGLYSNWGLEPDNYNNNQDALALSLNNWPNGSAGQWNDLDKNNSLYYIIEHPTVLTTINNGINNGIKIFPNPVVDFITINSSKIKNIIVFNSLGRELKIITPTGALNSNKVNFSNYKKGVYFIKISLQNGTTNIHKIIK